MTYEELAALTNEHLHNVENALFESLCDSGKTYEEVLDELTGLEESVKAKTNGSALEIVKNVRKRIINQVFYLGEFVRQFTIPKNEYEYEGYKLQMDKIIKLGGK